MLWYVTHSTGLVFAIGGPPLAVTMYFVGDEPPLWALFLLAFGPIVGVLISAWFFWSVDKREGKVEQ